MRLAEEAEPHLNRADQLPWLRLLSAELDNTSAALRWTISAADAPLALRLCAALGWYWFLHGRLGDGVESLEEILALPGVPDDQITARVLALSALTLLDNQPDGDRISAWLTRAEDICAGLDRASLHPVLRLNAELGGGTAGLLHVHMRLANELDLIGERERAETLLHTAMRGSVSLGPEKTAALHYQLGEFARRSGDMADALRGTRDLSQPDVLAIESATRADLGEEAFTAAYDTGQARTFRDVLTAFALPDPGELPRGGPAT